MATIFTTQSDGTGVSFRREADKVTNPVPAVTAYRADFDEDTNAALATDMSNNTQAFSFVGGTLVKTVGGAATVATFQPNGAYFDAKSRSAALLAKAKQVKAGNASFTGEDLADALAIGFHADGLPSA